MHPKRKVSESNLGKISEEYASGFISSRGYKVIEKNFRSRFGEVDIIALDGDTLVFVEVKARESLKFGNPEEAVTSGKLQKIKKTGEYYSLLNPNLPKKLRIDVVAIIIDCGMVVSAKLIKVT